MVEIEKFDSTEIVVLVVEDEPTTAALLNRLFSAMGAKEVILVREGAEALKLAFEERPALVICDVEMKPVDGLAFLGGIKASIRPEIAAIPVVMFSGSTSPGAMQLAHARGAADYLIKPFNPRDFAIAIKKVLAKAQPVGAA
jgi:two-component system chemotaxis response regulator CheY